MWSRTILQSLDVAIASIIIACVSVVVAAILAIVQMRDQNQTRQAQLFMDLYGKYITPEFHKRWMQIVSIPEDDILKDKGGLTIFLKGEADIETSAEFNSLFSFFEGIGLLVNKKLIDINLVAELLSSTVIWVWERISEAVIESRQALGRPQIYEWFEYLYQEIQRIPSRKSQASTQ